MRVRTFLAVVCCLVLACSKGEKKAVSPCRTAPLADLIKQHPVHVLCAAADVVPGAAVICDSTFRESWETFEPEELADHADTTRVATGIERLCAMIEGMPSAAQAEAGKEIESWADANFAIRQAEDEAVSIEYFASAVAFVPEVAGAIPDGVMARAPNHMAGETMASTEFTEMDYALAHILSRMTKPERDRVLEDVRTRAAELLKREE
jgi:hypothetical protein